MFSVRGSHLAILLLRSHEVLVQLVVWILLLTTILVYLHFVHLLQLVEYLWNDHSLQADLVNISGLNVFSTKD